MEYGALTFRFSLVEAAPRCLAALRDPYRVDGSVFSHPTAETAG